MKSYKLALFYGFLIWLIPFIFEFLISVTITRNSGSALFESIIVEILCVVLFLILYFRKVEVRFLKEGILLGVLWFVVSLVIDIWMLMSLPESPPEPKFSFIDYMANRGLTHLIIPAISISFGYILEKRNRL